MAAVAYIFIITTILLIVFDHIEKKWDKQERKKQLKLIVNKKRRVG